MKVIVKRRDYTSENLRATNVAKTYIRQVHSFGRYTYENEL